MRKSAIVAIILLATALASFYIGILAEARRADISSTYVSGNIPLTDPFFPQWSKVRGFNITLGGQTVVKPFKPTPSVHHLTVTSPSSGI